MLLNEAHDNQGRRSQATANCGNGESLERMQTSEKTRS